ncbi:Myotubularin-related protein 1 [Geodia barretti]|uniref:Myotubularin-related protein 1 n=1 Tax=Geodia barretti TaxID=519541 RepID=A0AA35R282_GEOBA|nr:Myotubularin-related protein 1 [Geodia barretti]
MSSTSHSGETVAVQSRQAIAHSQSARFMQTEGGNSGDADYEDEQDVIPIFTTDNDETEAEGSPVNTDSNEVETGSGLVQLTLPQPSAELIQLLYIRLSDIVANVADYPPAQLYIRFFKDEMHELIGWNVYNFPREMERQGVSEELWKLQAVNGPSYDLCETYPQLLYFPASVPLSDLQESAKFRSKGRLPCLVWVNGKKKNFMLRCAQPLTGAAGKHSREDELLIQESMKCGPPDGNLTIFDARSFSAATGNKIMGKGTEDITNYPNTRLTYLDIPNIHAVRESFESLKTLCLSSTSDKWFSALENTQWLNYISLILKGATMIARCLKLQQGNVLIHCSDGWDRTSQLTSLSQLLMDPYFRTVEGFKVLIEKEWLSFGHKFQQRLGHPLLPHERSPIFLQFLDCVHQIMWQYPNAFEFNDSLLLRVAEHINTAWFGTFLCNCDRERHNLSLYATTLSLWAHIDTDLHSMLNSDFTETKKVDFHSLFSVTCLYLHL